MSCSVNKKSFGKTKDGTDVDLYILSVKGGPVAGITNYGGILTFLNVPCSIGGFDDVVLGHDNIEGYFNNSPYFGCIVGRYANRIAGGCFRLENNTYNLALNSNGNHLHGGNRGFDKTVWNATTEVFDDRVSLRLSRLSPDGEEGYPGNLYVTVVYTITANNELRIDYFAKADADTIVNLTHHSYFNLDGHSSGSIRDHELLINSDCFTSVDKMLIPTGQLCEVKGTPMDFTSTARIGDRLENTYEQLLTAGGFDHNWVINRKKEGLNFAARLKGPESGRIMEVWTTEPGIQFYTGNFLDGTIVGKDGCAYKKHYGLCLETQHFPDSPNHSHFPSTKLLSGDIFNSTTVYKFMYS